MPLLLPPFFHPTPPAARAQLVPDVVAGLIVGIVALPLAIAFAIASGITLGQGLITEIIGGVLISVLGGSRVQIAGYTAAFIIIAYGTVQSHGYDGLVVATLMAGILVVAMGLARFGTLLTFIPYQLTVGFTSGIALIVFSSQLKDFSGPGIHPLPAGFAEKWGVNAAHAGSVNLTSRGADLASLVPVVV